MEQKSSRNTVINERLGPGSGNMSHTDPKTTSLMTSVTNNPHPQPKKFFSIPIY